MLSCVRMFANIKSYSNISETIDFIFQLFIIINVRENLVYNYFDYFKKLGGMIWNE